MALATLVVAEISFGKEENQINTPQIGEPTYHPISTCRRIEDADILKVGSQLLSKQVREKLGYSLSDYSDFPNLISLDDCGDFFLVSSVLGHSTVGERIRMISPKTGSPFAGGIDEEKVLLFYSRGE